MKHDLMKIDQPPYHSEDDDELICEEAIQHLVHQGLLYEYTGKDGVRYVRLTEFGKMVAEARTKSRLH
jgi:hypothetical protein